MDDQIALGQQILAARKERIRAEREAKVKREREHKTKEYKARVLRAAQSKRDVRLRNLRTQQKQNGTQPRVECRAVSATTDGPGPNDPTPAQIAALTAEIQAKWDASTRMLRAGGGYNLPQDRPHRYYRLADLLAAIDDEF